MHDRSMEDMAAPRRAATAALRLLALGTALGMMAGSAMAQVAFDAPESGYSGRVRTSAAKPGPVVAGSEVKVQGQGFKPGQEITIARGTTALSDKAFVVDGGGKFEGSFTLPADAAVGMHPLVLSMQKPYNAEILKLKVSPQVPLSGQDKFDTAAGKLVPGLYQSAYGAASGAVFVTSAMGRPPIKQSELLKLDPKTLDIVAKVTPAAAPGRDGQDGGVFAVYGVGVDDANGTVWVTNTRQNTVAVYRQSDLSLVKQFEPGTVQHARDVVTDAKTGKAFAGSTTTPNIVVFDAKAPAVQETIEIQSGQRGEKFSVGSLHADPESGKLYTVSLTTGEAAVVDMATNKVDKVFKIDGALNAIGVDYDPASKKLLVAAQDSDNLLIVDAESGKVLHDVKVGAGALNVAFEPKGKLAYVANRESGTVTVVDLDGNIVANLDVSPLANHVAADGKGAVYAVNKSRNPDDPSGDRITRIQPK